jgi:acetyltransferase-like isoleucine patch superfamily enzyme
MLHALLAPLHSLGNRLRIAWWRLRGVNLSWQTRLGAGVEFIPGIAHSKPGVISSGPDGRFSRGTVLHAYGGRIALGANVHLGPYTVIYGHGGVELGDHTLVSMHCRILSSNHTVPPPGTTIRSQPDIALPTRIGRDVWLGAGVTVLGGVTIGDGCVVGAGAVVAHDLPANSIAVGVPARVIRERR